MFIALYIAIDGLFSGEASASVGVTGSITPMLMVGVASSGGSARADAWLGVEVGLSLSAQATQAFGFDSGVASLTAGLLSHIAIPPPPPVPGLLSSFLNKLPFVKSTRSIDDAENTDVELNYCAQLYIKVKAGVEAKATWAWLHKWIGWTPSVSAALDLFTHQWVLSEVSLCHRSSITVHIHIPL